MKVCKFLIFALIYLVFVLSVLQVRNTAVHLAAYHGFSHILQLLIQHRANAHLCNQVTFA